MTMARAIKRLAASQTSLAWTSWVWATNSAKDTTRGVRIVRRVLQRMLLAKLGVAYGTWLAATRDLVRKQLLENVATDRMARTLRRIRNGRVAACFLTWSLFVRSRDQERFHGQSTKSEHRTSVLLF